MKRAPWLWLAIPGFLFALFSGLQVRKNQAGLDDFNGFFVGARLVFTGHLYDLPRILEAQRQTTGVERVEVSPSRLPFYYVFLSPLTHLDYSSARLVWFAIIVVAALLFPFVYPRDQVPLAAAALVSLPLAIATLGAEQDLSLMLLILACGMRLRSQARAFLAGLILSLLAIKINLILLVPVPLLLRREWRVLAGLVTGGGVLLAISFLAAGRGWIREWVEFVSKPGVRAGTLNMPNLHGVLDGVPHSAGWEMVLSAAAVIAVFLAARRASFEFGLAAAMLGSFLLSRHAYVHDCSILLPALVEVAIRARGWVARALAVTLITPFPYFLPPLIWDVRHGLPAAVLIAATLATMAAERRLSYKPQ
jgi:hypothetical protein